MLLINSPIVIYENRWDKQKNYSTDGDERSTYPLNVLYLAAYLESKGHSVGVIDVTAEGLTLVDIKKKVEKLNPRIVGISSMTMGIRSAVLLAKKLKKRGRIIGLGGVHLTCDPGFMKRFPYFDFGVVGEGEKVLADLVTKVKMGKSIKGLWQGEPIKDLDLIPFPARKYINPGIYRRNEQFKFEVPAASILSSRGCPFNCIFCSIPARGKVVRFRSAKNIVDEMEEVYQDCRGNYAFVDDCFTVNRQRVVSLCQEIIGRGLKTKWIASTRADCIDLELVKIMKEAGCTDLYFGVESGNDRIRNEVIGKRLAREKIREAVKMCRQVGIFSNFFLMIGFPSETKKEMIDTVKIGGQMKADIIGIHITIPMPGSRIYEYAVENKLIPKDIIDQYASGKLGRRWRNGFPLFVPEGVSLETLVKFKKLTYLYFYLSLRWWWRRLWVWIRNPWKFVDDWKLFKIAGHVFLTGGTKGQLS